LAEKVLLREGYTVIIAGNGAEAYQIAANYEGPIHLLLTDVVMPGGMSGHQLAQALMLLRPEIKVLYMSGYTENTIIHHGVLDEGVAFLSKPFVPDDLIRAVRRVLDKN
jgi:DNA-binding NtrC family response regulator